MQFKIIKPLLSIILYCGILTTEASETMYKQGFKKKPIFFDDFEYIVTRDGTKGKHNFIDKGGWSKVKAINIMGRHAGYLYTTTKIPGYTGNFPGKHSKNVLAIESKSSSLNTQTDFYLQYGDSHSNTEQVPGNVWFQFWLYINNYNDPKNLSSQISHFPRKGKFIYPSKSKYPSHDSLWLLGCCTASYQPYSDELGDAASRIYFHLADYEYIKYTGKTRDTIWKLGQTNLNEYLKPNEWTLVKIHIDTSTESGKFEQWLKPEGKKWTKVAEWIDGKTPNFKWRIPPSEVGGHKMFRMPTTLNPCMDRSLSCDFWLYMDDFVMADSEEALPDYPQ